MTGIIKVNELQGRTTANDITVTVGATATMSLGQGLAKAHANYNQYGNTVDGSFGISSVTDSATGEWDYNVTNNFNDAHYTVTGSSGSIRVIFTMRENSDGTGDLHTTSAAKVENTYDAGVHIDMSGTHGVLHGDLA